MNTIEDYIAASWEIQETKTGANRYNILTPKGNVFSYDDLIIGNYPICSQLDESIAPDFCDMTEKDHDENLIKKIREARTLARLIMIRDVSK
jgi:hypothetical protein